MTKMNKPAVTDDSPPLPGAEAGKNEKDTRVERILKYEEKFNISSYAYPFNIFSEIDRELAERIKTHLDRAIVDKKKLELFQKENKDDEFLKTIKFPNLRFILSTFGGSVHAAMTICAAFENAKKNGFVIEIHATGTNMSAGGPILCSGSKGHRYADRYTAFLIHNISTFMYGTYPELRNEMEFNNWLEKTYFNIFLENTKIGKKRLTEMLKYPLDKFFGPEEALQYGLVDHVE